MGVFKKLGIVVGIIIAICIVAAVGNSNDSSTRQTDKNNVGQSNLSTNSTNTKPTKDEVQKPTWNTTETDIEKNGNISIAVDIIKSNADLKSIATIPEPTAVAKAPWNYYGKVVKISGKITDIQEYPAGSDWSKLLGGKEAGQIVIISDDGTITDMFVMGSTGNLKNGDRVSLYGYPIGLSDVENRLGGKNTQLFIVGNSFDNQ
ncbi:hypothetical protein [Desnuesiella massiliensis]|uniref:hypothetical protein n=1 Tax=Desnuesiella massiliensis TaxID=1650662 RepID=UPI0018A82C29|nr:hypothetical protein [Desnuesiella massiliensis]